MRLSPLDIQHMEFARSVSGYSRQQVREFLERVADEREEILRDLQALRDEMAKKAKRIEELQSTEMELKRTIIAAERIANELKENAKREAELIVLEAEQRKREVLRDTEERLSRSRADLERLDREQNLFREQFRGILDAFSRSLDNLPSAEVSDPATKSTLTHVETD